MLWLVCLLAAVAYHWYCACVRCVKHDHAARLRLNAQAATEDAHAVTMEDRNRRMLQAMDCYRVRQKALRAETLLALAPSVSERDAAVRALERALETSVSERDSAVLALERALESSLSERDAAVLALERALETSLSERDASVLALEAARAEVDEMQRKFRKEIALAQNEALKTRRMCHIISVREMREAREKTLKCHAVVLHGLRAELETLRKREVTCLLADHDVKLHGLETLHKQEVSGLRADHDRKVAALEKLETLRKQEIADHRRKFAALETLETLRTQEIADQKRKVAVLKTNNDRALSERDALLERVRLTTDEIGRLQTALRALRAPAPAPALAQAQAQGVVADRQNIHLSSVQSSARRSVALIMAYRPDVAPLPMADLVRELESAGAVKGQLFAWCSLTTCDPNGVSFYSLLERVWLMVKDSPHRDDMARVLCAEIRDAVGMCFTGRFTRIVNALSGFVAGVAVGLSENERMNLRISAAIQRMTVAVGASKLEARRDVADVLRDSGVPAGRWPEWLDAIDDA